MCGIRGRIRLAGADVVEFCRRSVDYFAVSVADPDDGFSVAVPRNRADTV
jgi:hypothetical protein